MIVEVAHEKLRNDRFIKLYYSAFKKNFRGVPRTVTFNAEATEIFTSFIDDSGGMCGLREDLENVVFIAGACLSKAPDGKKSYFDPLHLKWLQTKLQIQRCKAHERTANIG